MKVKQISLKNAAICLSVFVGLIMFSLTAAADGSKPIGSTPAALDTSDELRPRMSIPASSTPTEIFFIDKPGHYYLAGHRKAASTGIVVDANDVTIDLMGYSLIGPGSGSNHGILLAGQSNVEIKNGEVKNFGLYGIYEPSKSSGEAHRIVNVKSISNGYDGICLYGKNHTVKNCKVTGNGGYGIRVGDGCLIAGNTSCDNRSSGIYTDSGCTITGNTAFRNKSTGIYTGSKCTLETNLATNNKGYGIYSGSGCTLTRNRAHKNQISGIYTSRECSLTSNMACNNQSYGIFLASGSSAKHNVAYENNKSGRDYPNMNAPASCILSKNVVNSAKDNRSSIDILHSDMIKYWKTNTEPKTIQ